AISAHIQCLRQSLRISQRNPRCSQLNIGCLDGQRDSPHDDGTPGPRRSAPYSVLRSPVSGSPATASSHPTTPTSATRRVRVRGDPARRVPSRINPSRRWRTIYHEPVRSSALRRAAPGPPAVRSSGGPGVDDMRDVAEDAGAEEIRPPQLEDVVPQIAQPELALPLLPRTRRTRIPVGVLELSIHLDDHLGSAVEEVDTGDRPVCIDPQRDLRLEPLDPVLVEADGADRFGRGFPGGVCKGERPASLLRAATPPDSVRQTND